MGCRCTRRCASNKRIPDCDEGEQKIFLSQTIRAITLGEEFKLFDGQSVRVWCTTTLAVNCYSHSLNILSSQSICKCAEERLIYIQTPDTTTTAMIVASFLLASWLGCVMAASPWSDRIGRRVWVMAGAVTQVVGTIISSSAYSVGQLIAGRVLIVSFLFPIQLFSANRLKGCG
jgi:MFS family permease